LNSEKGSKTFEIRIDLELILIKNLIDLQELSELVSQTSNCEYKKIVKNNKNKKYKQVYFVFSKINYMKIYF